ncbi:MAG: peroxiredoxin family protein [Gemmatimonadaceae bacterium]
MARGSRAVLDAGDVFPRLRFHIIDGSEVAVPKGFKQPWNVVLFNRGHWCPYCVAQLKSFQGGLEKLAAEGIGVISASVDSIEHARETQAKAGATFPIAYGLPVLETAEAIGAFYDPAPSHTAPYIQSTGFLLSPDGRVVVSVYSSGAIGRLVWQDVLGLVGYLKEHS